MIIQCPPLVFSARQAAWLSSWENWPALKTKDLTQQKLMFVDI